MKLHINFAFVVSSFLSLGSAFAQNAVIDAEVTGVDGRPSQAAEVRIERQDKAAPPIIAKTDRHGRSMSANLPPGTYKLTAVVEGGIQSSQTVKAGANKSVQVAFDMRNTPAMRSKAKKKYVWVQAQTGTRIGGYWAEAGDDSQKAKANGQNVDTMNGRAFDDSHIRMSAPAPGSR